MKEHSATSSTILLAILLAAGLAGCSQPDSDTSSPPTVSETEDAAAPAVEEGTAEDAAEQDDADGTPRFDVASVPISTAELGEFPHLKLPDGYVHYTREGSDYDRVAIWTGDRLEWVEGRVFGSAVRGDDAVGKTFALLEFQRNMQAAIREAGGYPVAKGQIPRELREEIKREDPDLGVRFNAGLGDIWNRPVETFLIRRADRQVWIHMGGYEHSGNLLIVETKPLEITAGLLPAAEMKKSLEGSGRVALQVHFATDKAEILPESAPQIEQVTQMLKADEELALSIEGHTDNTGTPERNLALSQARADSVVSAITDSGVSAERLSAKGHGDTQAVAENSSEEGRAKNRRVELVRK